jgi:ABC-type molybdenum transport system ATPase subunit/photorepair protein PhrA
MVHLFHISDLHFTTGAEWNNMKKTLFDFFRSKCETLPIGEKLLVITGDFHNFWDKTYNQALEFLPALVECMGIEMSEDVFVIPGNHDAVDDAHHRKPVISYVKGDIPALGEYIPDLLPTFKSYVDLVEAIEIYPKGHDNLAAKVHVKTWRNKLNILHLNTAIIADGSMKNNQLVDIISATSKEIRNQLSDNGLPSIAIGHNSFYDLHSIHRSHLEGLFKQEHISAYLCGDHHIVNTERNEKWINLDPNSVERIPNIVAYKGTADEKDTYSDVGVILHQWDLESGNVNAAHWEWDSQYDQTSLQPNPKYDMCYRMVYPSITTTAPLTSHDSTSSKSFRWILVNDNLKQKQITPTDERIKGFLSGKECFWDIAFSDKIVQREIVSDLLSRVKEGGIIALLGAGGEGKSTAIKQMCVKLYQSGYIVWYLENEGPFDLPDTIASNTIFVVDNPPDTLRFKEFLKSAQDDNRTVVLSARYNEWNLIKKSQDFSSRNIDEYTMPQITGYQEAEEFAQCVMKYIDTSRNREDIINLFQQNSGGFLYASMLMVIHGRNSLSDIAKKIIYNLKKSAPKALLLMAYIVLSEHAKILFSRYQYNLTLKYINLTPKEAHEALELEVKKSGVHYETRHEVISKLFYQSLFKDESVLFVEECEQIYEQLIQYHISNFRNSYGYIKTQAFQALIQCESLIEEIDNLELQEHLFVLLLDEVKSEKKSVYKMYYSLRSPETKRIFLRICLEKEISSSKLVLAAANIEIENGNIGSYDSYSARHIFYQACLHESMNGSVWLAWAQTEEREGRVGTYEEKYSARWIYQEACLNRNADSNTWLAWAQSVEREGRVGTYEEKYSARWIYQEACLNRNANGDVWLAWGQTEEREGRVGTYEEKYSARWIYQEACLNHNANGDVWLAWGQMEEREGRVGTYEEINSARWIYQEACLNRNADSNTWLAWGQMEEREGRVGTYEEKYSSRWIYQEACLNRNADSNTWRAWGQMEEREDRVSTYEVKYSARWIYQEACLNRNADSNTWLAWGQMEEREGRVGTYEEKNSARWIYQEVCLNRNADSSTWLAWGQMEERKGRVGTYEEKNSARWIYQEACLNYNADSMTWLAWAKMEEREDRMGTYEEKNSARWIYSNGIKHARKFHPFYSNLGLLELRSYRPLTAKDILSKSLKNSHRGLPWLAILQIIINRASDISQFLSNMEANIRISDNALLGLYHCNQLLGNTDEINKYEHMIKQAGNYHEIQEKNKKMEQYIILCREAVENSVEIGD